MVKFNFPNFRLYQPLCFLLGFILYIKSFHKGVDFLCKKVYNLIRIKISKIRGKFVKNGSRKKRKNDKSNNGVVHANICDRGIDICFSVDNYIKQEKGIKCVKGRKSKA